MFKIEIDGKPRRFIGMGCVNKYAISGREFLENKVFCVPENKKGNAEEYSLSRCIVTDERVKAFYDKKGNCPPPKCFTVGEHKERGKVLVFGYGLTDGNFNSFTKSFLCVLANEQGEIKITPIYYENIIFEEKQKEKKENAND